MIAAVTSVGRAVVRPRISGATNAAHHPAGALSRPTESLRPLAALNARSAAAMSRGHRHRPAHPWCWWPAPARRVRLAGRGVSSPPVDVALLVVPVEQLLEAPMLLAGHDQCIILVSPALIFARTQRVICACVSSSRSARGGML